MAPEDVKRKLAAILSADAKDYSRLMQDDEAATVKTLTTYREAMDTLIRQHHGRVVDSPGDNLLAEFDSMVDAVQGAVAIQKELKVRNSELPEHRRMRFRIGLNLGDVIVENQRIYGDGVNIAARLEKLADPGGICLSRTAFDQIEDKLPLGYEYIGEKAVKNIAKPVHAYRVLLGLAEAAGDDAPDGRPREAGYQEARSRDEKPLREKNIYIGRHPGKRKKPLPAFRDHLYTYIGVIGFLFILNLMTSSDYLWVKWPALGWGLALFLHWGAQRSRSGRTRDVDRSLESPPPQDRPRESIDTTGMRGEYLKIQIEPLKPKGKHDERVNVRIPLRLIRSGAKLGAFLPTRVRKRLEYALREKGMEFDLKTLKGEKLEEVLTSLIDMTVDIDRDNKRIRISCE